MISSQYMPGRKNSKPKKGKRKLTAAEREEKKRRQEEFEPAMFMDDEDECFDPTESMRTLMHWKRAKALLATPQESAADG